jgi:hypothetical protein
MSNQGRSLRTKIYAFLFLAWASDVVWIWRGENTWPLTGARHVVWRCGGIKNESLKANSHSPTHILFIKGTNNGYR